eukprot:4148738-Prymnesium_polylepis.1
MTAGSPALRSTPPDENFIRKLRIRKWRTRATLGASRACHDLASGASSLASSARTTASALALVTRNS